MLLIACGTSGGAGSGQLAGGATVPAEVTFDADVAITGAELTVTWRVVNRSSKELVAPTLVTHQGKVPKGDAYVVPAGDNIEIAQRLFDWPDEVEELAVPPSVGVLRVRPGTTESRTIRVPRPLTGYHPFGDAFDDGPPKLPSDPVGVVFCLGVVPQPYPPALALGKADGVEIALHGRVPYAQQHRFCTDPVAFR
ncbi:hypothetical protein EV192_103475 [Actinocrispum wychmicini]|uniref:Uncharacterized protein n=2 Tax=Actinocrispum wychmicini TaxID=1213861 RepID=A0A4R2JLF9_9PSEU|nr:hypothetical protein EV192_103475 [Actinocrispum wychmicini]